LGVPLDDWGSAAAAFQIDPVAGTFAAIALCLNAVLTAVIMWLLHSAKLGF
jgi:putative effector of murein hydrolase